MEQVAYIPVDHKEQFREMIHNELDKWVDELLVLFDEDSQPTLTDISEVFTETQQKFLGACVQVLIEQRYADFLSQEYAPCPQCGKLWKKRTEPSKEIITMQWPSSLTRPQKFEN
jgi:hypothetical protein